MAPIICVTWEERVCRAYVFRWMDCMTILGIFKRFRVGIGSLSRSTCTLGAALRVVACSDSMRSLDFDGTTGSFLGCLLYCWDPCLKCCFYIHAHAPGENHVNIGHTKVSRWATNTYTTSSRSWRHCQPSRRSTYITEEEQEKEF